MPLILESRPGASQLFASEGEPQAAHPTCSVGVGAPMTRRFLMNSIVALPIATAVPTAAPAMLSQPSDVRLVAAAEGLFVPVIGDVTDRETHRRAGDAAARTGLLSPAAMLARRSASGRLSPR